MPRPAAPPADKFLTFGLASRREVPSRRTVFHRHNEAELLWVERGWITHLFGGQRWTLAAGELALFWGAVPHLPVEFRRDTVLHWLTVPLAWFLQWQLPGGLAEELVRGRVFRRPAAVGREDRDLFLRWHADLCTRSGERHRLVLLECEARLRRLLIEGAFALEPQPARPGLRPVEATRVEAMTACVARHYTGPLTVADIARAAGLHPDYAGALFRRTCGRSFVDYLTAHRLSHAQRLLATTDTKVIDVAFAAGFGSASRFYAAFVRGCGCTPRAFRRKMQSAGPRTGG